MASGDNEDTPMVTDDETVSEPQVVEEADLSECFYDSFSQSLVAEWQELMDLTRKVIVWPSLEDKPEKLMQRITFLVCYVLLLLLSS